MDGYAGAVADGVQRNVRLSRALRPTDLSVRSARCLEILEPMQRQRRALDAERQWRDFDVDVTAPRPPFDETPHVQYRYGRVHNHVLRYTQLGRAHGQR